MAIKSDFVRFTIQLPPQVNVAGTFQINKRGTTSHEEEVCGNTRIYWAYLSADGYFAKAIGRHLKKFSRSAFAIIETGRSQVIPSSKLGSIERFHFLIEGGGRE